MPSSLLLQIIHFTQPPAALSSMSVNIITAVPPEVVSAVNHGTDASKMADALATITKAAVESIKSLPSRIEPATAQDEEDNVSIKSFDSNEPAFAPRASKKVKRGRRSLLPRSDMQVFVNDRQGKRET